MTCELSTSLEKLYYFQLCWFQHQLHGHHHHLDMEQDASNKDLLSTQIWNQYNFFHIIHDILEKYLKEVSGKKLLLISRKEE